MREQNGVIGHKVTVWSEPRKCTDGIAGWSIRYHGQAIALASDGRIIVRLTPELKFLEDPKCVTRGWLILDLLRYFSFQIQKIFPRKTASGCQLVT
ncbi:MAG: hypothetical protein WC242_03865 [Candidatus Paceibacterota bacterium]|jgi:hypothetical protein